MIRKILFPILTHVCSCIPFFVIFLLTWLGPEGGILLPLLPAPILFGATIIPFFANIHSDAPIWAMVGLNFIISVAAYIFAGRKKKSTQVVGA